MSSRGRGRPKNSKNKSSNDRNQHHLPHYSQQRLELKRINADTHSIHSIDSSDSIDLLDTPIVPNASRAIDVPKKQLKLKSKDNETSYNEIIKSIKAGTVAVRNDVADARAELKADINSLTQRTNSKLKAIDDKLATTNSDIQTLFSRVRAIESGRRQPIGDGELHKQLLLKNNFTISNVPLFENENLLAVVNEILHFIGCEQLVSDDVADIKRARHSKTNMIIVKLRDEARKIDIMKRKGAKPIMLSEIFSLDPSDRNSRIYIGQHCTPHFSHLNFLGRMAVSKRQIDSCWVGANGFFIRHEVNSKPIPIVNSDELNQFIAENCRQDNNKRNRSLDSVPSPTVTRPSKQPHTDEMSKINEAAKNIQITATVPPNARTHMDTNASTSTGSGGNDGAS